ncbi:MAG TPA: hypothetical protein VGN00_11925 [Puia sp.]|jgi:hypothetical protein
MASNRLNSNLDPTFKGMKPRTRPFLLLLVFFSFSCNHLKQKKAVITAKAHSSRDSIDMVTQQKRMRNLAMQAEDSVLLKKGLDMAMTMAYKKGKKSRYTDSTETVIEEDKYIVQTTINQDYYFSKAIQHLIVRRTSPTSIYIDIFIKKRKKFERVVSYYQSTMAYINDTVYDVNGDGRKDFVVNWYGTNGCCLKAFSNVFLLRADKASFSDDFELINPTFSPKEGIVRGVCYGHPGDTELYKYKWQGERLDTLEYISYEKDKKDKKTGRLVISNNLPYSNSFKVLNVVKSMPREYKKVIDYNWFTGNL